MSLRQFLATGLVVFIWPSLAPAEESGLQLENAWVRALPPTQPTTAAYMSLSNGGSETVTITGATVTGAGRVEIHRSLEVDGLMRMEQLTTLELAAGSTLELAPGGTHLMLFDLEQMPKPGEQRRICLQLAEGQAVCADADVRKSADAGGHHHHH